MTERIVIYEPYTVVAVPFPFTDKGTQKKRPALVVSSPRYQRDHNHVVLCMITSAQHSSWETDVLIQDLKVTKLSSQSLIRMKFFTLDARLILEQKGHLSKKDQKKVQEIFKKIFAFC